MSERIVAEQARHTPVIGEYEVVVLGGGPGGLAAAVATARSGRRTILVERYGFLGGMGTAAGVTNFCGLHANVHGEHRQIVHGVADDLLGRIDSLGGLAPPHLILKRILAQAYDVSAYKIAADDFLVSSGSAILFHALAVGLTLCEGSKKIEALLVETKSGRGALRGEIFIDASGDGDLAAWAGAPFEKGDGHGNMLYPSAMFRVSGVDPAAAGEAWNTIPVLMDEAEARGEFKFPRKGAIVRPQKNPTEWRANLTQLRKPDGTAVDGIDAESLSEGELQGRRQVLDTYRFLRTVPGFADSYIVEIAPQIGIRETRRICGEYALTAEDVLGCRSFDDVIGLNGWPIEAHIDGDVVFKFQHDPDGRGYNHLPYRMLLPLGVENLLVAGRCASMTHEGQSAARVTGACFAMGQAAGSAADLALRDGIAPRDVPVARLQAVLEDDGVLL